MFENTLKISNIDKGGIFWKYFSIIPSTFNASIVDNHNSIVISDNITIQQTNYYQVCSALWNWIISSITWLSLIIDCDSI